MKTLFLALALLSGCVTERSWHKSNSTHQQFDQDSHACNASAEAHLCYGNGYGCEDDQYQACMREKGWTLGK